MKRAFFLYNVDLDAPWNILSVMGQWFWMISWSMVLSRDESVEADGDSECVSMTEFSEDKVLAKW